MGSATDFDKLGLTSGQVVQELGWDTDVDEGLRQQIMDAIADEMVDDSLEAVDVVLLWLRSEDGDVADALVDGMRDLSDDGYILVVTPKVGRAGAVDTSDLDEGSETAGMVLTSTYNISEEWQAHKVVRPRGGRR